MRYFFHIAFRGTEYRGWQRQENSISVQKVFEDVLSRVLGYPLEVTGCGRTDALVHASQYFAHVDIQKEWSFDLIERLNKNLPEDIAVYNIVPVDDKAHARYDAVSRTYIYRMHKSKNPFLEETSSLYSIKDLDIEAMSNAIQYLTQYDDYLEFCKTPTKHDSTICRVSEAKVWASEDQEKIEIQVTANRFLRSMMRILVHELLEIGKGTPAEARFQPMLQDKKNFGRKTLAYPQGLSLVRVKYPYLDIEPRVK